MECKTLIIFDRLKNALDKILLTVFLTLKCKQVNMNFNIQKMCYSNNSKLKLFVKQPDKNVQI